MEHNILSSLLPAITAISSIGIYASQLAVLSKIKGNVNNAVLDQREAIPILPYIATFTNCCLWYKYGLLTDNSTVKHVNVFGIVTSSIIVYSLFANLTRKKKTLRMLILIFFFLLLTYIFIKKSSSGDVKFVFTLVCCFATILFFTTPLASLPSVFQYKNASVLSKPTAIITLVSASLWTAFGMLISDYYIVIPNMLGVLSALVLLYAVYRFDQPIPGAMFNSLETGAINISMHEFQQAK